MKKRKISELGQYEYNNGSNKKQKTEESVTRGKKRGVDLSELNQDQRAVLDAVASGRNVFFTGSAGTGKTFLLRKIIEVLREKHSKWSDIAITASTGIAAEQIGGTTFHSFSGVGVPKKMSDFDKMWYARTKWRDAKVLIIDEISMIAGELFDAVDNKVQQIRGSDRPFGGVQIIACGDFFQLPPVASVPNEFERQLSNDFAPSNVADDPSANVPFIGVKQCFEGRSWNETFEPYDHFELTQVFRQDDEDFVRVLNELRYGTVTPTAVEMLKNCDRPLNNDDGIEPTKLFSLNRDVNAINNAKLRELKGEEFEFSANDFLLPGDYPFISLKEIVPEDGFFGPGYEDDDEEEKPRKKVTLAAVLEATKKCIATFYNKRKDMWTFRSLKQNGDERDRDRLLQDPFWKNSQAVDKLLLKVGAQVMLLKNQDFSKGLVNGSRGVVTRWESRGTVLNRLLNKLTSLKGENDMMIKEQIFNTLAQMETLMIANQPPHIPIVKFVNGEEEAILPASFSSENSLGKCVRFQIPLKLAWALTIHKCQGMTLDRTIVSLEGVFAKGQAYVALSRVRSLKGLQLLGFSPAVVKSNESVLKWMKRKFGKNPDGSRIFLQDEDNSNQITISDDEAEANGAPNLPKKEITIKNENINTANYQRQLDNYNRPTHYSTQPIKREKQVIHVDKPKQIGSTPPVTDYFSQIYSNQSKSYNNKPPMSIYEAAKSLSRNAGAVKGGQSCFKCNKSGHWARDCPQQKQMQCFKCGQGGHFASNCPKR